MGNVEYLRKTHLKELSKVWNTFMKKSLIHKDLRTIQEYGVLSLPQNSCKIIRDHGNIVHEED